VNSLQETGVYIAAMLGVFVGFIVINHLRKSGGRKERSRWDKTRHSGSTHQKLSTRRGTSRTRVFAVLFLVVIAIAVAVGLWIQPPGEQKPRPTVVIDGVTWVQSIYWNFSDGFYPSGWSWGNWSLVEGELEGRDPAGEEPCYFFPFDHDGDFILETEVKFIEGTDARDAEAQLLTRDSENVNFESGMALFVEENAVTVRHMADNFDYIDSDPFAIGMNITYGEWYVMRFMVYEGVVKAFVNWVQVFESDESYPVTNYHEPHLTVIFGVVRFKYVRGFVAQ
jgi:hypothetical protein